QAAGRIGVGKPEEAQRAAEAARVVDRVLEADLGDREPGGDMRRLDLELPGCALGEREVGPGEVAGGDRLPLEPAVRGPAERLLQVPEVDRPERLDAVALDPQAAVPGGHPAATPVLRALPDDAHAPPEVRGAI